MQVRFWGTRGSLPVALTADAVRSKIIAALTAANGRRFVDDAAIAAFTDSLPFAVAGSYGGSSSCVEIIPGGPEHFICDLGSGARALGQEKLASHRGVPQTYHIFLSHLHWDHLMGFPFFGPAYVPGNRLVIHGCHARLEEAVRLQMTPLGFPVAFEHLASTIEFHVMAPGEPCTIAGVEVTAKAQRHGGDSYAYRFAAGGRSVVYATDSEHHPDDRAEFDSVAAFFADADLVIFDAMYSLAEAISIKADWGHSSNIVGVELCQAAGARRLALFHHEPVHDDATLDRILAETRRFEEITRRGEPLAVLAAYDGLTVNL